MKKLFTKLVVGTLAAGCMLSMASCSPRLNIDDVEDALKDKDYIVTVMDGDDYGAEYFEQVLYAVSEDGDDSFMMAEFKDKKSAKLYYESEKLAIENEIAELKAEIKFYEQILAEYEDDMKNDEVDEIEDDIKDMQDEIEELEEEIKNSGRNGVYVWQASSEDAMEDAQG